MIFVAWLIACALSTLAVIADNRDHVTGHAHVEESP